MQPRSIFDLDTPALLIDLDVMDRNLARAAVYTNDHKIRLRPHSKTHKSTKLGRLQLSHGAVGLTVAKVSEAEVMLGAEPKDLLVAFPIIGPHKLSRLMAIAGRTAVTVSLDSEEAAGAVSAAAEAANRDIGILLEMDVGWAAWE